jgi:hypothetical protein
MHQVSDITCCLSFAINIFIAWRLPLFKFFFFLSNSMWLSFFFGLLQNTHVVSCTACSIGKTCPVGSSSCTSGDDDAAGDDDADDIDDDTVGCPAGEYEATSSLCLDCAAGQYQVNNHLSTPRVCVWFWILRELSIVFFLINRLVWFFFIF